MEPDKEVTSKPAMLIDNVARQKDYVSAQQKKGQGLGIVFADAFLRGMRDIGYKNPAWALAEQLDNAFQAGASTVAIRIGYGNSKTRTKPEQIAICDDGNGMIPEMIGFAVRWGGTDREGDRTGFGRYGYGLPSSAVSLAKRYTVYSKTVGGEWHAVTVDIDELAAVAGDVQKTQALLDAKPAALPEWVVDSSTLLSKGGEDRLDVRGMRSGTVVVLEHVDRLAKLPGWIKVESLRTKLLNHFGTIYRHWIPERRITVDGVLTEAVDPLFLMEHGRFFAETGVRARQVKTRTFEVETSRGTKGTVSIRASLLPPDFQLADPAQYGSRAKTNSRFDVMKANHGFMICRERRQIDTIIPPWTKFQNYDLNVRVEIDFDPELDEYFGITTAKQQIVIDEEMWEKLKHSGKKGGGLMDLLREMRSTLGEIRDELDAKRANQDTPEVQRLSATAMTESEKFKGSTLPPTPEQIEEAQKNLEEAAKERAAETGESRDEAKQRLVEEAATKRWEVEFAAVPEGPFYRPKRLGELKTVVLNTDHPFYSRIYSSVPAVQPAIEVLLFVLSERELDARGDAETFYKSERQRWSERLRHALESLVPEQSLQDTASALAEKFYVAEEEARLTA